ncbi:MarR family winged helix-turn-helix transcriptional regulator [Azospirillum sp. A39]|uniref:MarR family winged helix-turn-helix transcriptional regulator n=1 Tax=Azospirillum sp. A39 TaxID=3462279 RepID=UPI0040460667
MRETNTWPGSARRAADGASRARGIARLVDQTVRAVTNLCWTEDLQAAQWAALRYFGSAGAKARNVVGLSRYQGTNPGTASRTIAVLERRGLVAVAVDPDDKRGRIVSLTETGRDALAGDPLKTVEQAIAALPPEVQTGLATGLRDLLDRLMAPPQAAPSPPGDPASRRDEGGGDGG